MPNNLGQVTISRRALVQRVQRRLAHDDQWLVATRGSTRHEYGPYLVVNRRINGVLYGVNDLEALARELGVLRGWETVTD